jgi:hypothetical protein
MKKIVVYLYESMPMPPLLGPLTPFIWAFFNVYHIQHEVLINFLISNHKHEKLDSI